MLFPLTVDSPQDGTVLSCTLRRAHDDPLALVARVKRDFVQPLQTAGPGQEVVTAQIIVATGRQADLHEVVQAAVDAASQLITAAAVAGAQGKVDDERRSLGAGLPSAHGPAQAHDDVQSVPQQPAPTPLSQRSRAISFVSEANYGDSSTATMTASSTLSDSLADLADADETLVTECEEPAELDKAFHLVGAFTSDEKPCNPIAAEMTTAPSIDAALISSRAAGAARHAPLDRRAGLGFCTWEALGPGVAPRLSAVLAALESAGAATGSGGITAVLIDDGWAQVTKGVESGSRGRLVDWDLQPELLDVEPCSAEEATELARCSSELARYVRMLKSRFPHVQHVGVWLTLAGYWDGLQPGPETRWEQAYGPLLELRNCSDELHGDARTRPSVLVPRPDALQAFWDDCFAHLRGAGISFVKVDNQAEFDFYRFPSSGSGALGSAAQLGRQSWYAMMGAAGRTFEHGAEAVLHCMSISSSFFNGLPALGMGSTGSMTVR